MPVSSRCPQGTYFHVFQRRAKLPPQVFRKSAKNVVQKSKECPQLPHFAVIPKQQFPGPRRGFWQPSTFNCPRTRSQKRLVGTHVTVVTGPCASNQNIPSVLRKKKSVHHPGLAPEPPQDKKTLQDPGHPARPRRPWTPCKTQNALQEPSRPWTPCKTQKNLQDPGQPARPRRPCKPCKTLQALQNPEVLIYPARP